MQAYSPAQIIKSSEIKSVCDLRIAVQKLAASTYRVVSDWKYKKKSIDIEIEKLSNKINRSTNEEDEFELVIDQLYILYTENDSEEKRLLKIVEELINARREFTELKNDTHFPLSNKINLFGVSFFLLNLFANKLHITVNANYPIFSFVAAASYFTGSMSYRIIWKKCYFQPSLKDKAEKLRKLAKQVYQGFLPNPPKINPDVQSHQYDPRMQYQKIMNERVKNSEKESVNKQRVLKITNGKELGTA